MRIAITGADGQLGRAIVERLQGARTVQPLGREFDLQDTERLRRAIIEGQPEVVIHAAAFTDVDGCERDPDRAFAVNGLGTQTVALACQAAGAAMLYVSTNCVFDGRATEPYREHDHPAPISVYGRSKYAGEWYTRNLLSRFWIVRTSWLFGPGRPNFITKVLAAADRDGRLEVVDDEIASPTLADDLAGALVRLVEQPAYGIYHLTNRGYCSRYDLARLALSRTGRERVEVRPIKLADYQRLSSPPPFSALENFCAATLLGLTLPPWEEAVDRYLRGLAPPLGQPAGSR